jgi:hypothetical protein
MSEGGDGNRYVLGEGDIGGRTGDQDDWVLTRMMCGHDGDSNSSGRFGVW